MHVGSAVRRTLSFLFLAVFVLAGCSSIGGGGDVIKPEPTKNPMAERSEKSGQ
jgi:hypothetical protein